jgi:large subunit ribosomal protein L7e
MTYERKKPLPENLARKAERDAKLAKEVADARAAAKEQAVKNKQYYLEQGKKYYEQEEARRSALVSAKRDAKQRGELFVEEEGKLLLVVRIKGINKMDPKPRKILRLLRLRQLHNAVLLRNNKAVMNMLRRVEPYVTYGTPSLSTIRQLVYKRGYGKVNKQRIPLSSNYVVEEGLGALGIRCVEDLINEVYTVGPNFKKANNFLWPFKLSSPKGGLRMKRTPYLNGGDFGPRGNNINAFAKRMI